MNQILINKGSWTVEHKKDSVPCSRNEPHFPINNCENIPRKIDKGKQDQAKSILEVWYSFMILYMDYSKRKMPFP